VLAKIQFLPGFNKEVTPHTNEGGWVDGDKVRFRGGFPETIGGWVKQTSQAFRGVCRSLINWNTLNGTSFLGLGTNLKYYIGRGGAVYDITPIRETTAAGAVTFAATNGSNVLTVTDNLHGALVNDFVTFSGAVGLGGNVTAAVLNAEHQITAVVGVNSYRITLSVTANGSDTGNGGASVVGAYQVNTGLAASFRGNGWGAGAWGESAWGAGSDTSIEGERLRIWTHTTFGEDLIINPRGGGLYYWDSSVGVTARAVHIPDIVGADEVPLQVNTVRLSQRDRHVIAFGATPLFGGALDPLLIRWCSQEDYLDWNPDATNTAGDLRLSAGNQIVTAEATTQEIVILTDNTAHAMQFIGPPYTFGLRELASGVSAAGPNCAVTANDAIYWMGLGAFYRYNGVVEEIPCAVKEYVFDLTMDKTLRDLVCAGHNSAFSEIWWFYPGVGDGECSRYVVYNYAQSLWYYGTMARTAWIDQSVALTPLAAGTDGYVYAHETGTDDGSQNPAVALESYIQSSAADIGDGEDFVFIRRLIPDVTFRGSTSNPQLTMTLTAQNFPGEVTFNPQTKTVSRSAPLPVEQFTTQLFVRLRGRAAALRVASSTLGTSWRLGTQRIDITMDGKR
jgi:hypothetical protein